jgi:hypothetical protein
VSLSAHGPGEAGVDPLDLPALRARSASAERDNRKTGSREGLLPKAIQGSRSETLKPFLADLPVLPAFL